VEGEECGELREGDFTDVHLIKVSRPTIGGFKGGLAALAGAWSGTKAAVCALASGTIE